VARRTAAIFGRVVRRLICVTREAELAIRQERRNGLRIVAGVAGDVRILRLVVRVRDLGCAVTFAASSTGRMVRVVARHTGVRFLANGALIVGAVTFAALEISMNGMIEACRTLSRRSIADRDGDGNFLGFVDLDRRMTLGASSRAGDRPVMASIAPGRNPERNHSVGGGGIMTAKTRHAGMHVVRKRDIAGDRNRMRRSSCRQK